jgi:hypothetical protein
MTRTVTKRAQHQLSHGRIRSLATTCILVFINFTSLHILFLRVCFFKACCSKWRNFFCSVTRPTAAQTCHLGRAHLTRVLGLRPYLILPSREICPHYTYLGFGSSSSHFPMLSLPSQPVTGATDTPEAFLSVNEVGGALSIAFRIIV